MLTYQCQKYKKMDSNCVAFSQYLNCLLVLFLTEAIQYHDGLRSRELGQAPILLCAPNS